MNDYCIFCMKPSDGDVCPSCGKKRSGYVSAAHHLQPGSILHDKYYIGTLLGEGGFGITYVGRDMTLDMKVAIKEYFPNGIVNRNNTVSKELTQNSGDSGAHFEKGKRDFLSEARALAKFASEQHCVSVRDFFEENNTAYIVMEYLEGIDLRTYIEKNSDIDFSRTYEMLSPVMKILGKIHKQGIIHRDISPANIMILESGDAKLLDFGAAREVNFESEKSLSIMLKPGYAPEEQYRTKGKQGPWTDIYALSATIYKMLTGVTPTDSMNRVFDDDVKPVSELNPSVTKKQDDVIMKGMSVRMEDRYASMEEMLDAYKNALVTVSAADAPVQASAPQMPSVSDDAQKPDKVGKSKKKTIIIAALCCAALLLTTAAGISGLSSRRVSTSSGSSVSRIVIPNSRETSVDWSGYSISVLDIKRLKKCKKLNIIKLNNCNLGQEHMEQIAELVNEIESSSISLYIAENPDVSDISCLNMDKISKLDISGMNSETVHTLPKCPYNLSINGCGLSEIDFLENGIENLYNFSAEDNSITDISILLKNSKLENLNLKSNKISDLSPLKGLVKLDIVNLSNNEIEDISPLDDCFNIFSLDVSNNRITDISTLKELPKLSIIKLHHNSILSLAPLAKCEKLKESASLDVRCNKLRDCEGLEEFNKLKTLMLSHNKISDISRISDLSALEYIELNDNALSGYSIYALGKMPNLKKAELIGNDISFLGGLLDELDKSGNKINSVYLSDNENIDYDATKNFINNISVYDCASERRGSELREKFKNIIDASGTAEKYYSEEEFD